MICRTFVEVRFASPVQNHCTSEWSSIGGQQINISNATPNSHLSTSEVGSSGSCQHATDKSSHARIYRILGTQHALFVKFVPQPPCVLCSGVAGRSPWQRSRRPWLIAIVCTRKGRRPQRYSGTVNNRIASWQSNSMQIVWPISQPQSASQRID